MLDLLDTLAQRVGSAVELIQRLRDRVAALERDLEVANRAPQACTAPQSEELSSLREEIERLQGERHKVRERIRALIREFDKVSW
jgi:FtsZ-binding cell division protein ZapB